jgi:glycosyltransferase involved in cell wall biosynthesis
LFGEKDYGLCVPPRMQAAAIDQERHNYALATAIVCMGSWVKQSLIDYYGVSPDKIYQILPGANMKLPHGWIPRGHVPGAGIVRPLVLGFIGKDWKRKGLQDLIEIKNFLREKGYKVLIKAVGNCPDALAREDGLEYTGFIDKQHDTDRFIDVISSCDIGCLLSKSEALGISTLEFLRVGVPVAGYYHQGLQDTLLEGAALRFSTGDSPRHIASIIENYIKDEALQRTMRAKAWEYSPAVTWERCVEKWSELVE